MTKTFWGRWGINPFCDQGSAGAGGQDGRVPKGAGVAELGQGQGSCLCLSCPLTTSLSSLRNLISRRDFFAQICISVRFPKWPGNPHMQSLCMTVTLLLTNNFYLTNAGLSEVQRKVLSTRGVKMVDEESEVFGIKGFKQSMGSQSLCALHNTRSEDKSL